VRALAFSPDEQSLLTGSDDGLIKLFDVATGEHRSTFSGHASWVLSVAWSPDNQRFASG
jgi:WD repeat-containing protein 61